MGLAETQPAHEPMYEDRRDVRPSEFTEAEHAAVDAMAAPLLRQAKADKSFKGRRNRDAWMRMNRPEKTKMIDKGAGKIFAFLDRVIPEKESTNLEEAHKLLDTLEETV